MTQTTTTKLTLSWRIGLPLWDNDQQFSRLLEMLLQHRSVVDEVALFETVTHHLYIPLDVYARRMELAAQRLKAFRQAGVASAGINVLCTIGHINEGWSYMPPLPFQAMVGHDGGVSTTRSTARERVNSATRASSSGAMPRGWLTCWSRPRRVSASWRRSRTTSIGSRARA